MSIALINANAAAAVAAIEAGDFATAETKLLAAQTYLSVLPDSQFEGEDLSFDREAIDNLLRNVRSKRSSSAAAAAGSGGGIRRTNIVKVAVRD